jgi:hypothetical protein
MKIALSLLFVTGLATAGGGLEPSMVPFSELNLGGIEVGQTGESITRVLGEPKAPMECFSSTTAKMLRVGFNWW